MKTTTQGFEDLKYKLKKTKFALYPVKDDWGCYSIGYSNDEDKIISAIEEILEMQAKLTKGDNSL